MYFSVLWLWFSNGHKGGKPMGVENLVPICALENPSLKPWAKIFPLASMAFGAALNSWSILHSCLPFGLNPQLGINCYSSIDFSGATVIYTSSKSYLQTTSCETSTLNIWMVSCRKLVKYRKRMFADTCLNSKLVLCLGVKFSKVPQSKIFKVN